MKTMTCYQNKNYDIAGVPLERTTAPIYILVLDLFIYFWKTINSKGNYDYSFFQYLSLCIKILESNINIQGMRKLTLTAVLISWKVVWEPYG